MRGNLLSIVSHGERRRQILKPTATRICYAVANSNFSIQADKIQTILGAAKIQEVEPIWSSIFAKVNTRSLPRRCLPQTSPFCESRSSHNVRRGH